MAIIENIIERQNFEIVRDLIGSILKVELENQKTINSSLEEDINIFSERTTPIGNDEELMLNVQLSSSNYDQKTQQDVQGKTIYYIDIYTTGKENDDSHGGFVSAKRLHKFIGLVRYILSHTEYKTLTLPFGVIGGTMIESFNILDQSFQQDTNFFKMARVEFSVRIQESQTMAISQEVEEFLSNVKLDETDKGYEFQLINQ